MRHRIGLIIPSSNTTMEYEFRKILPEDFTIHTSRMLLKSVTLEGLKEMEVETEKEAYKLATADVDIIGYGCTTGSLFKGLGHDKEIVSRIEKISRKPAVATAGAVIQALKKLDTKRVAIATPYIDELNMLEKKFIEDNGFEVIDLKGLGYSDNIKIGRVDYDTVYELVKKLNYKDADTIFISCTNFPTIGVINKLEKELKKPVFSSNTATLWMILKKLKTEIDIRGYGILLEKY